MAKTWKNLLYLKKWITLKKQDPTWKYVSDLEAKVTHLQNK